MRFRTILAQQKGNVVNDKRLHRRRAHAAGDRARHRGHPVRDAPVLLHDRSARARRRTRTSTSSNATWRLGGGRCPRASAADAPSTSIRRRRGLGAPNTERAVRRLRSCAQPNGNGCTKYCARASTTTSTPRSSGSRSSGRSAPTSGCVVVHRRARRARRPNVHTGGGTPDIVRTAGRDKNAKLLWDPDFTAAATRFSTGRSGRCIDSAARTCRADREAQVVTGPAATRSSRSGRRETYLQLFGLAQPTKQPRSTSRTASGRGRATESATSGHGGRSSSATSSSSSRRCSRSRDAGLAAPAIRPNDTLYRAPTENLSSSQRPRAIYHLRARYLAEGGGDAASSARQRAGPTQLRAPRDRRRRARRDNDYASTTSSGASPSPPDTLFPRPRQRDGAVRGESAVRRAPTTILGLTSRVPLETGEINFTAIRSSSGHVHPPAARLRASVVPHRGRERADLLRLRPLTRLAEALPFVGPDGPSRIAVQGELATSRPQPNPAGSAYIESFEGEGGITVGLSDQSWALGESAGG